MEIPDCKHFVAAGVIKKVSRPTLAFGCWIGDNFHELEAARLGVEAVRFGEISGRDCYVVIGHEHSLLHAAVWPLPSSEIFGQELERGSVAAAVWLEQR